MLNKQCKVKLIAASLGLAASLNASAAMGGLQVQSNLDEPFSGTVVVTGDEARALAGSAKPAVIGANLTATVTQQGSDRAVIRLRSSAPMKEPVLTFWLGVGNQNRQYTAMLDPKDYQAPAAAQQPARRSAQEAPKAGRERAAEPRRQAERERNRPRQAQASGRVEVVRGSRYQVKDGELLVDIAQRVQPSGLTLRQTINALVRANPKSFRNGNPDLMYSGTTLIIPEAAQLRRLAYDSQIRVRAGAEESTAPVAEQTAAPQQPAAEAPAQSPTPPAVSEPAKPAVTEPVEAPAVSEPAAASAELPALNASEAVVSEVSEPVAPPVVEQAPVVETPAAPEPQPDWTQWALYGAGGVVVLGGLAYLLAKRRKKPAVAGVGADAAGDDDEDDLFFEDIGESAAAGKAAPAPAVTVAADAVKEDDLYLDADQLAAQQHLGNTPDTESVAAASEAAAEEDDWSWLEDQTEEVAVSSVDEPAPAAPVAAAAASSAAAATAAVVGKSADDWLDFGEEALPEAVPEPVSEPVSEAVADDLAWVWDEDDGAAAQASTPLAGQSADVLAETARTDADLNVEFTVADNAVSAVAASEVQAAAEDEGLSFDIGGMPADEAGRVPAPQEAAGFDAAWQPEVGKAEVSALDFSVDGNELSFTGTPAEPAAVSAFDDHAQDLDFNLNFVDEAEPAVQAAEPPIAESSVSALDFASEAAPEAEPAQLETEALDWAESVQQPAALPQEALEAKLELAKMYLEIDDANTARQTLMELVNESNGSSIQAQAQALLQELG